MVADISCTVTALVPALTVNYLQNNLMYRFLYLWECVDMYRDLRILRRHYISVRSAQDPAVRQRLKTSTGALAAATAQGADVTAGANGFGVDTDCILLQHCAHVTALLQLLKPRMTRWRLQPHHVFVKRFSAEGRCECQPSVAASRFRCE